MFALAGAAGCRSAYTPLPLEERGALIALREPAIAPDVAAPTPPIPLVRGRPERAPSEPIPLRLEQAQSLAIVRHPRLAQLRAARGLGDAADQRAQSRPDPELSFAPSWIVPEAVIGAVASLRWEILPSGTREARRGLAGALRDSIDARIASEEWRLAQEVRVAWLQVVHDERALSLAERGLTLARETREFARVMLENGVATEVEGAVLDLELAEAEREIVARRGALSTNRERLTTALGLPPGTRVEPRSQGDPLEPLEARVPDGDADDLLLERVPELREARASYAVAEREVQAAHLLASPRVSIGPEVQRDATSSFLGAGISATLPIWDRNRAGILEADARRNMTRLAFTEALFAARASLAEAREEEDAALRLLATHEALVAPRAAGALSAAQRASDAGTVDLLALLTARQRALRAERDTLDLRAAHAVAVARLESAYGPEPSAADSRLESEKEGRHR